MMGCALAFTVAAALEPDPSGVGTHRQLGYAPCLAPILFGRPCPTCGMTTAFAYAARGDVRSAFHAQPAGLALALAVLLAGIGAAVVLATGKVWQVNWYRLPPRRVVLAAASVVLTGWLYKMVVWSPAAVPVP